MAAAPMDFEDRSETAAEVETRPEYATDVIDVPVVAGFQDSHVDEPHGEPEELTPEQQEIKFLRDELAKMSGRKDVEQEFENLKAPGADGNILIHFLEDGMTALGQVWYRGQELEFEPGSRAYKDTFNRRGETWLSLAGNDFAQVDKWGKVMFRPGPWPGKTYLDGEFEPMKAESGDARVAKPSPEELERAEKLRTSRRAAPVLSQQV